MVNHQEITTTNRSIQNLVKNDKEYCTYSPNGHENEQKPFEFS
jgi:hypothetical protein